jgi:hypothetical protein
VSTRTSPVTIEGLRPEAEYEAQTLIDKKAPLERARGFLNALCSEASRLEQEVALNRYKIRDLPQDQKDAWALLVRSYVNRILASVEALS